MLGLRCICLFVGSCGCWVVFVFIGLPVFGVWAFLMGLSCVVISVVVFDIGGL